MISRNQPYVILFLIDYLHSIGGAEKNLLLLLRGIDRNKFLPIVCCLSGGELVIHLKEKGYEVYNLDVKRLYNINGIKAFFILLRLIKRKRINLLITYHESSDFLGLLASKIFGLPVISSRRDMGFKLKKNHIIFYRLFNRYFSKIIAVSDAVKKMIMLREKTASDKIVTIYNGVDINIFQKDYDRKRVRNQLNINNSDMVVGIIAGVRKIKGHTFFIEAASIVVKEFSNIKFIIVGSDSNENGCSIIEQLKKLAVKLDVFNDLIFTGERDNIPELLSAIDIVVNASLSEGMSNTILEAMCAGKTVIASDVGGNPELIKDYETGILVPPGDSQKLSQAIKYCLKNRKESERLGKNAQDFINRHHNVSVMCNRNMELYINCIKGLNVI